MLAENPEFAELSGDSLEEIYERRMLGASNSNGDLPPCTDGIGPMTWFNTNSVKEALHVGTDIRWAMCSDKIGSRYKRGSTGTYYLYPSLIE
jgi:hypothetical protein